MVQFAVSCWWNSPDNWVNKNSPPYEKVIRHTYVLRVWYLTPVFTFNSECRCINILTGLTLMLHIICIALHRTNVWWLLLLQLHLMVFVNITEMSEECVGFMAQCQYYHFHTEKPTNSWFSQSTANIHSSLVKQLWM